METVANVVVGVTIAIISIAINVFIFVRWGLRGWIVVGLIEVFVVPTAVMLVVGVGTGIVGVAKGIGHGTRDLGKAVAGVFRHHPKEPA